MLSIALVLATQDAPTPIRQIERFVYKTHANDLVTVPRYGGGTVRGFRFEVLKRPDGASPYLRSLFKHGALHRILNQGYAHLFCGYQFGGDLWDGPKGVILPPGTYLFVGREEDDCLVLQGKWLLPRDRVWYWERYYASMTWDMFFIEWNRKGFRFTVKKREDGSLPVVTTSPALGDGLQIWKVDQRTAKLYGSMVDTDAPSGIPLEEGEYFIEARFQVPSMNKFAVALTGYWSAP